jgi:hypothetical protein
MELPFVRFAFQGSYPGRKIDSFGWLLSVTGQRPYLPPACGESEPASGRSQSREWTG